MKNITNFKSNLLKFNLGKVTLAEVFHENTKIWPYELKFQNLDKKVRGRTDYVKRLLLNQTLHNTSELTKIISNSCKKFKDMPNFPLRNVAQKESLEILDTIKRRRSTREFSGACLNLTELSTLLYSCMTESKKDSLGITLRNTPSAGALYPLEVYITLPSSIDSHLPKGILHYNPKGHYLTLLNIDPQINVVKRFISQPEIQIHKSATIFYITGLLNRSLWKYGDRAYRYMLIEAGHLAQNMLLLATSMKLGCCPIGGFIDNEVNDYLGLDGVNEVTLYIIVIGKIQKKR